VQATAVIEGDRCVDTPAADSHESVVQALLSLQLIGV